MCAKCQLTPAYARHVTLVDTLPSSRLNHFPTKPSSQRSQRCQRSLSRPCPPRHRSKRASNSSLSGSSLEAATAHQRGTSILPTTSNQPTNQPATNNSKSSSSQAASRPATNNQQRTIRESSQQQLRTPANNSNNKNEQQRQQEVQQPPNTSNKKRTSCWGCNQGLR